MYHRDIRRALKGAALVLALATAAAGAEPQPPMPAGSPMSEGAPFRIKLSYVQYQVNPDFTYTEEVEMRQELLTEMGARMVQRMPLGAVASPSPAADQTRTLEVLSAYTLKKSGQRIPATQQRVEPPQLPKGMPPMPAMTMIAFHDAEVGDTVVFAYKATQRAASPPGNIVLNRVMTRSWIWDDVQISLRAPARMLLRSTLQGLEAPVHVVSGATQQWTWKYSNPAAVKPAPGTPPYANVAALHISSFPTDDAEQAYFATALTAKTRGEVVPADPCTQLSPSDGPDGLIPLANLLGSIYLDNPADFERRVDALNSPKCVLDDGRPQLMALRRAFESSFTSAGWDKSYDYIKQLKAKFPERPFVALAEAEYWIDYAWDARGTGYSGSVTNEGWGLFRERLQNAENVLLQSRPYASSFPFWYQQMLQVQFLLNRPAGDEIGVFDDGRRRYPAYYPLYFTMANFLAPKWGGSWRMLDGLVKASVEATKKEEGETLYARLYWRIADEMDPGDNLFRDTSASWPRMKKGFEQLIARYPKSMWNLNNFAHIACMAGDRKTYRKLRKQIGKNVMGDAWEAEPSLDLCEVKYGV